MDRQNNMVHATWVRRFFVLAGLSALIITTGCGSDGGNRGVSGKVSFQGAPVAEGTITFEDASSGFVNSAELAADGAYSLELPDGSYAVCVNPPFVEVDSGPESPPDEVTKDMPNIPPQYRRAETSGWTVQVAKGNAEHEFDMVP